MRWRLTKEGKNILDSPEGLRMKVIAFNGWPRKKWDTATLLGKDLEGARHGGAET